MPLPWKFVRNTLAPVRLLPADPGPAAVYHVRVYSDPWGGDVVIIGQLEDQALSVEQALRPLWARFAVQSGHGPVRVVSYVAGSAPTFRHHRQVDDVEGVPVPSFPVDQAQFDGSAQGVRMLQHGPCVDVWDPVHYRFSAFQLARVRERARQLQES